MELRSAAGTDVLSPFELSLRLSGAQSWTFPAIRHHKNVEAAKLPGNIWYHIEQLLGGVNAHKRSQIINTTCTAIMSFVALATVFCLMGFGIAFTPSHMAVPEFLMLLFGGVGVCTAVSLCVGVFCWTLLGVKVVHPAKWVSYNWSPSMTTDHGSNMPKSAQEVAERIAAQIPGAVFNIEKLERHHHPGLFDPILYVRNPLTGKRHAVWVWNPDGSAIEPSIYQAI